jgi:hypothetical protein
MKETLVSQMATNYLNRREYRQLLSDLCIKYLGQWIVKCNFN